MPKQTGKIRLDGSLPKAALLKSAIPQPVRSVQRQPLLPGGWWFWCLIGLAIGLASWFGGRQYLRHELATQLEEADSEQSARQSIEGLLRLDGDASVEVARGIAHRDFLVANTAYRALNQQLDRWRSLEADVLLRRMVGIADELDRMPSDLDEDHKILISGLASRVYAEALGLKAEGSASLLERCKRLMSAGQLPNIRSSPNPESPISEFPAPTETTVPPPLAPLQSNAISDRTPAVVPPVAMPPVAMPVTVRSNARLLSDETGQELASPNAMPRMSSLPNELAPISSGRATVQLTAVTPQVVASLTDTDAASAAESGEEQIEAENANLDEEESISGIDRLTIDQLVRLLSSVQPKVAQAASFALRRKGMSDEKLTLAMHLATGSAPERLELLGSIARRDDLDPRPWLLWMAADGEERVREHAVGLLNPMLDIDTRRQLRLLLNRERDQRVAQTIRKVLVQ